MKKSVQALINRRRARVIQSLLAAVAGLILVAMCVLLFNLASGPITALLRTATPTPTVTLTPTLTFTPAPATPTSLGTDTPTPTEGPSPTPTPVIYTVQDGDTLFDISTNFQVPIFSILAASGLPADTSILAVGQVLTIPVGGGFEPPTVTPIPTGLPRGSKILYTVLLGDSLEIIAAKFNSTAEDIAQQNRRNNRPLTNASLQAGDVLTVRIDLVTVTPTLPASVTPAASPTP
jgi:LysM repeat protein